MSNEFKTYNVLASPDIGIVLICTVCNEKLSVTMEALAYNHMVGVHKWLEDHRDHWISTPGGTIVRKTPCSHGGVFRGEKCPKCGVDVR